MGRSTVSRSSVSLGCLKTNFKKLTNNQEYEPVSYIMSLQLFFSNSILCSLSIILLLRFVTVVVSRKIINKASVVTSFSNLLYYDVIKGRKRTYIAHAT